MTDEKIFIDFQKGKIDSLYKNMYGKLILYATHCLGGEMSFMSEDCVQDAIFKAYQSRATFRSAAVFKSFLYTCVHNQSISILRKQMAYENYLGNWEEEEFQNTLLEQEVLELLFDSIRALPEKYRRLFELSFEQGLKNAEVAELLNVSESAVKKQKATMIRSLREDMRRRTDKDFFGFLSLLLLYYIGKCLYL